jgi:hypothetical protein
MINEKWNRMNTLLLLVLNNPLLLTGSTIEKSLLALAPKEWNMSMGDIKLMCELSIKDYIANLIHNQNMK